MLDYQSQSDSLELSFQDQERRTLELYLVVAQHAGGAVVVARELALLGEGLHQGLGELEDVAWKREKN